MRCIKTHGPAPLPPCPGLAALLIVQHSLPPVGVCLCKPRVCAGYVSPCVGTAVLRSVTSDFVGVM